MIVLCNLCETIELFLKRFKCSFIRTSSKNMIQWWHVFTVTTRADSQIWHAQFCVFIILEHCVPWGVVYVLSNDFVLTNHQRNICPNAGLTCLTLAKLVAGFSCSGIHMFCLHFFFKNTFICFFVWIACSHKSQRATRWDRLLSFHHVGPWCHIHRSSGLAPESTGLPGQSLTFSSGKLGSKLDRCIFHALCFSL